jgi:hypothetical protein
MLTRKYGDWTVNCCPTRERKKNGRREMETLMQAPFESREPRSRDG